MVKHIILWTLNPELSEQEKKAVKAGIKEGLEGLVGKVPGLIDVKVQIDGRLDSSNADVMLDSTLESYEALKAYAKHPAHVAVADTKVRPYTVQRRALARLHRPRRPRRLRWHRRLRRLRKSRRISRACQPTSTARSTRW